MTDRILKILDNVRYWETCPEDYKKDIETFLEAQSQALHIHDVSSRRELLKAFYKSVEDDYLYPDEVDMHVDDFLESL